MITTVTTTTTLRILIYAATDEDDADDGDGSDEGDQPDINYIYSTACFLGNFFSSFVHQSARQGSPLVPRQRNHAGMQNRWSSEPDSSVDAISDGATSGTEGTAGLVIRARYAGTRLGQLHLHSIQCSRSDQRYHRAPSSR